MLKTKPLIDHTISPEAYCIIGIHKVKGQRKGDLRFDTYHGAMSYIDKVCKRHKAYKNYICFLVKRV